MDDINQNYDVLLFFIAIIIIIAVIVSEYRNQDCIPGKECYQRSPTPLPSDNIDITIERLKNMIINNYQFIRWRMALIGALIGTILIVYLLKRRIPNLSEYLLIGLVIFLVIYFSLSWLNLHFFRPNGTAIEHELELLRKKIKSNNVILEDQN